MPDIKIQSNKPQLFESWRDPDISCKTFVAHEKNRGCTQYTQVDSIRDHGREGDFFYAHFTWTSRRRILSETDW